MAGSSYGTLTVTLNIDTRQMASQISSAASSAGAGAARNINTSMSRGMSSLGGVASATGKAIGAGLGIAAIAAVGFGVKAVQAAARVQEMNASLVALGKANHVSGQAMLSTVGSIQKMGIETATAQTAVARFTQNHLRLTDATKLATVAQNAAVLTNKTGTETMNSFVQAIMSGRVQTLKKAGITVNATDADKAYAAQIGVSVGQLTQQQKAQALLNAVLSQGSHIAGVYAAAMNQPAFVLKQMPVMIKQIEEGVGTGLLQAFGPMITAFGHLAQGMAAAVAEGGPMTGVFQAIGGALKVVMAPLTSLITHWDVMMLKMRPGAFSGAIAGIRQFGPAMIVAGGALAAFTGSRVLTMLPGIGPIFSQMIGPIKQVGLALSGGQGGLAGVMEALRNPLTWVIAAFGLLMATSPQFRAAIMQLVMAMGQALMPIATALLAVIRPLMPAFTSIAQIVGGALAPVIRALVPVIMIFATILGGVLRAALVPLVPIISAFAAVLRFMAPVLPALTAAMIIYAAVTNATAIAQAAAQGVALALSGALKLVAAAQWLVDAAMDANPIMLVVIALAALVAAAIYAWTHFTWFRTAVLTVWSALQTFAGWIATGFIAAWNGITTVVGAVWGWVSAYLIGTWNNIAAVASVVWGFIRAVIVGAWNGVVVAATTVWGWITGFLSAEWNGIVVIATTLWNIVRVVVTTVWNAITAAIWAALSWISSTVSAMWNGVAAFASAVWNGILNVIRTVWNAITAAIWAALSWIGSTVAAMWNGVAAVTSSIWNAILGVIRNVWNAITAAIWAALQWCGSVIAAVWNGISATTSTIWNGIVGIVSTCWNRITGAIWAALQWCATTMSQMWGAITRAASDAWNGLVNEIGSIFSRLGQVVQGPVNWVVQHVINPLIRGLDFLITKVGIPAIPQIPGFARGGVVPGGWGGGDRVAAMLEPGEFVLTKHQARAIGYGRLRNLPHYQEGGIVGSPPHAGPRGVFDWLSGITGKVIHLTGIDDLFKLGEDVFDSVTHMLNCMAAEAFKAVAAPLSKALADYTGHGAPFPHQWLGKLIPSFISKAIDFIVSKSLGGGDSSGIVAAAEKYNGHPYRWGGPANASTGFDCSSFVNFIAGSLGLPLPGGFRAPSGSHGPATTQWLSFGGMRTVPGLSMAPGNIYVNSHHMGIVTGKGKGFAARSTATGTGPQNVSAGAYTIRAWKAGAGAAGAANLVQSGTGAGGPGFPAQGGNVARWTGIASQVMQMLGRPDLVGLVLSQIASESGGNPTAQNNWDINARNGDPSRGLMQVIGATFAQYAGPFAGRGIFDPLANIYAAMNYALQRYGSRITAVLGHGHGYARGGVIGEHVVGLGMRSGDLYHIGERGPEFVSPLRGTPGWAGQLGAQARNVINVYPQPGQDERQIAAAVSRELAWAAATGAR